MSVLKDDISFSGSIWISFMKELRINYNQTMSILGTQVVKTGINDIFHIFILFHMGLSISFWMEGRVGQKPCATHTKTEHSTSLMLFVWIIYNAGRDLWYGVMWSGYMIKGFLHPSPGNIIRNIPYCNDQNRAMRKMISMEEPCRLTPYKEGHISNSKDVIFL